MTTAQLGDITIEYESTGSGPPLLLIMGLSCQLIHWPDAFVERIAERGYQVIRFDNRDIGLSTKFTAEAPGVGRTIASVVSRRLARSEYLLADMADDTARLLDHLGVGPAHVVGASMGGMIAQSLAIAHPDKVRTLTSIMSHTGDRRYGRPSTLVMRRMPGLMRGAVDADGRMSDELLSNSIEIGRLISGPHFDEAEERATVLRAFDRCYSPDGTMRQMIAIAASPNRTRALRDVAVPTLVIHGLLDRLVQPSGGIATARAVPGSRLLMFPDMAHDLPRSRWDEIVDAIDANAQRAAKAVTSSR